jgi:division protein CdvB (Snf7/Vps24/ESCRT-III family)
LQPEGDLRNKIKSAVRAMDNQGRRMDTNIVRLQQKDKQYYSKIVESLKEADRDRATFYANELAEVRKALRSMRKAKLALEQVSLRLGTVQDIGDLASTLGPAINVLGSLRGALSGVFPSVDEEFSAISDLMHSLVTDVGEMGGVGISPTTASEEAERILRDAEQQVETDMKDELPSVPEMESTSDIQF